MIDRAELKEKVYKCCEKFKLEKELFYVARIGKGKTIEFDWSNNKNEKPSINTKYIVKYFLKYNLIVIWNKFEKKERTKKMTIPQSYFKEINDAYLSGTEYKSWHTSEVFIAYYDNIENAIKKCDNEIYQYHRKNRKKTYYKERSLIKEKE